MHNGPMWSYTGNTDGEVESAPSADQSSEILTQALQQTFECDSELLQEVTFESNLATEPTENYDVSDIAPVESNIGSTTVTTGATAVPTRNVESFSINSTAVSCAPIVSEEATPPTCTSLSRSSLWSSLSESQRREDEGVTLNERELGEIHGICPSNHGACNTERNPLKLLLLMLFNIHAV